MKRESTSTRLKQLMEIKNLRQADIVEKTKLGKSAISQYVSGKVTPKQDKIYIIASAYDISPSWLMGYDVPSRDILIDGKAKPSTNIPIYEIPVVGKVVAGTPIDAIENITDYIRVTNPAAADGSYYALHVTGASMEPEMREGDLVIVHKQDYFDNGDICIVLVNGYEATVKKVQKNESGITLIGFNSVVYPPHFYNAHEVKSLPVRVIGKVEEVRRKY